MKRHTKIYMESLGYEVGDFIPCEVTGREATDVHHITARGMGGNPSGSKDCIENLMALCREQHDEFERMEVPKRHQYRLHYEFLRSRGVTPNEQWQETE